MSDHTDWETLKQRLTDRYGADPLMCLDQTGNARSILLPGHRYPCPASVPELYGITDRQGHQHQCIHDDGIDLRHPLVEHRCECGMTWTEPTTLPAPDKSWIEIECGICGRTLNYNQFREHQHTWWQRTIWPITCWWYRRKARR